MTKPDYHAMCAELIERLEWFIAEDETNENDPGNQYWLTGRQAGIDSVVRARALLAQPEPEEEDCPGCEGTPVASNSPCAVCGRAVLARWGNSQAILDSSPTTPIN